MTSLQLTSVKAQHTRTLGYPHPGLYVETNRLQHIAQPESHDMEPSTRQMAAITPHNKALKKWAKHANEYKQTVLASYEVVKQIDLNAIAAFQTSSTLKEFYSEYSKWDKNRLNFYAALSNASHLQALADTEFLAVKDHTDPDPLGWHKFVERYMAEKIKPFFDLAEAKDSLNYSAAEQTAFQLKKKFMGLPSKMPVYYEDQEDDPELSAIQWVV